jgi:tetratricopeptide (TPR) repeat protein
MTAPRIGDLERRVQTDPASVAFAALAEEYRRAGRFQEAVEACRAGLVRHPAYVSARVTLGRALIELGQLGAAKGELEIVLALAPDNLAAIRGLADLHRRLGELPEALERYRAAQGIARHDAEIHKAIEELSGELQPEDAEPAAPGLSFEQARDAILSAAAGLHEPAGATAGATAPEPPAGLAELERLLEAILAARAQPRPAGLDAPRAPAGGTG